MHMFPKRYLPGFAVAGRLLVRGMLVAALLLLVGACRANDPWVEVGGQRYYVEIADDDQERARGLMYRDELGANEGM